MSYSSAIFFMDYENGSDAARSALANCNLVSNGSGGVRCYKVGHGLVTGAVITVPSGTYSGNWKITYIDVDNFDLDTAVYSADRNGVSITPFGGMNWTDAWKTITSGATSTRIAPGDEIRIAKSPAPASIGNATWNDLSKTVTLATAQTLTIDNCETAWTANGAGDTTVTRTGVATDAKQGSYCMKLQLDASPQTNTMQAYYAIASTDYSSYQKISFWIKNSAAILANQWTVTLCSDTAGATPVDTFAIPAIPSTNRWLPLTLARNGGGNLGNAIQSIAINTGSSAPTNSSYIYVDNFIACTTNGLNLQSLISKNSNEQGGTEGWYGIQSIDGTTILLDNETNTKANAGRGYSGTTETVTTYKRETIKTDIASSQSTQVGIINDSGEISSPITFSGGWNTSTNLQDGETFFDGLNGNGYCLYGSSTNYITVNHISSSRYYSMAYFLSCSNSILTNSFSCNNYSGIIINSWNGDFEYFIANNNYFGVYLIDGCSNNTLNNFSSINNINYNLYILSYQKNFIKNGTLSNSSYGIYGVGGFKLIGDFNISNSSTSGISITKVDVSSLNLKIEDATEITIAQTYNTRFYSHNHDQTADNHWIFTDGGTINSQDTIRHTASGIAWKMNITSTNRKSNYPLHLSVGKFAVNANSQVTINIWMKKSHATNIVGKLVVKGGQLTGVDSDVTDTKADDTDWEQLQVQFTPTEKGVIEAEVWAYLPDAGTSVTDYIVVDDVSVTQV